MDRLSDILRKVLEGYTGEALNGYSYLTESKDGTVFSVVSVGYLPDKRIVDAGLIVRLLEDRILIERDTWTLVTLVRDVPVHKRHGFFHAHETAAGAAQRMANLAVVDRRRVVDPDTYHERLVPAHQAPT